MQGNPVTKTEDPNKLTGEQIIKWLDDEDITAENIWEGSLPHVDPNLDDKINLLYQAAIAKGLKYPECYADGNDLRKADNELLFREVGMYQIVEQDGGGEGDGEHVQLTIHFPKHDVYLTNRATYMSYHGIDSWEGWFESIPVQKVITVYEKRGV